MERWLRGVPFSSGASLAPLQATVPGATTLRGLLSDRGTLFVGPESAPETVAESLRGYLAAPSRRPGGGSLAS